MQSIRLFIPGKKYISQRNVLIAATFTIVAALLAIVQDLLHASYNGYPFYLSESLLFKAFWGLFFPISILQIVSASYFKRFLFKKTKLTYIIILSLVASTVHALLFSSVVWSFSYLFFDHTYLFAGTWDYTITEHFHPCLLVYGAIGFLLIYKNSRHPFKSLPADSCPEIIAVSTGRNSVTVDTDDIIFITAATPYVCLHTSKGKFLHTETLTSMAAKLGNKPFVRIHKSTIVNISQVVSYQSRLNGDYDVALANGATTRLSRNYAVSFKKHFI